MNHFSISQLKQLPIVMTSMSRWDGDFSSASWSLAKTFSQKRPVLYVDYPFTLIDFFRERSTAAVRKRKAALLWGRSSLNPLPDFGRHLYALTPPLTLPVNWLPRGRVYRFLAKWNDRRLANSIIEGLKRINEKEFIFFNSFNPLYMNHVPPNFKPTVSVYQSRDNIRALEPYLRKHGAANEIQAIRNADLNLATSRQLQTDLQELSGKEVAYFPNAADFDLFKVAYKKELPLPEELKDIPRPMIGYTGNICHRLDYDLIAGICAANPDISLVLVGPRNHAGHTRIDLDKIPNLYFTGPRKIEQLPGFLSHFDLLILPFLCNDVTKSIYPLKINEYLASGKPVVATPFSADIRSFFPLIRLQKDASSFALAIRQELDNDTAEKSEKRYLEASTNTWEEREKHFWELLAQTFSL